MAMIVKLVIRLLLLICQLPLIAKGASEKTNDSCTADSGTMPDWWRFHGFKVVAAALLVHCLLVYGIIKIGEAYFYINGYKPFHSSYVHLVVEHEESKRSIDTSRSEEALIEGAKEGDREILRALCRQIGYLGALNFVPVPIFFGLTAYSPKYMVMAATIGIAIKAVVAVVLQGRLVGKLHNFIEDTNPAIRQYFYEGKLHSLLPIPMWMTTYIIAFADFADLDFDCVNAGQSWGLSHHTRQGYCASWVHVPIVGQLFIRLGLAGTLSAILVFGSVVQIYEFSTRMWKAFHGLVDAWPGRDDISEQGYDARLHLWFELQHACDASSLTLLAERLNLLAKFAKEKVVQSGSEVTYAYVGRSTNFWVRNCAEAVPSAWFSVSLLGLSYRSATDISLKLMIVSIVSSMFTIIKACLQEFMGCAESIRVKWILAGYEGSIFLGAVFRLNILLVSTYVLVASMVRFGGVWYCSSHLFNLTHGCVELGS